MLKLLAFCGVLTYVTSLTPSPYVDFNFGGSSESDFEDQLREQEFSEEKISQLLEEFREGQKELEMDLEADEDDSTVSWAETRGYAECAFFKTPKYGYVEDKKLCSGCLKPKSMAEICAEFQCPFFGNSGIPPGANCGFMARQLLSANWAVTSIDAGDLEKGYEAAFWRLYKYLNGANTQGATLASSVYMVNKWSLGDHIGQIEGAQMAFFIPSPYQDSPPAPTDGQVAIEFWSPLNIYSRAFGGDRSGQRADVIKNQYRMLQRALGEGGVSPNKKMLMTFEFVKPGCGSQRSEVILADHA